MLLDTINCIDWVGGCRAVLRDRIIKSARLPASWRGIIEPALRAIRSESESEIHQTKKTTAKG